jgi:acyl carrier protein
MDHPDIHAALVEIIRDVLDDPDFEITPETSARDHAEWSSFTHINIVVAVEIRFGIKFQTGEIESLHNVGDFAALIARKSKAA